MMTNPHSIEILKIANRVLPLTHLHATEQRRPAIDIIGDLYAVAEAIDKEAAPAVTLPAGNETLAKLGAAVALARLELESAYQRTESISERHRLAPLIATMTDALKAYRADPATPKAPAAGRHAFEAVRAESGGRESILDRFTVTKARTAEQAYDAAEALCEKSRPLAPGQAHFVREINATNETAA